MVVVVVGVFPLFYPCHTVRSALLMLIVRACERVRAYVCMRLKVSDSGIPAILVNHADRRLRIPPVHHDDYPPAVNAYTCTYILIHSRLTCKLYYLAAFEDKNRTHC